MSKDEERAARLGAALRDNLRRRKVQARGRADDAGGTRPAPGAVRRDAAEPEKPE